MKKKKLSWNWTKIIWWFIFITLAGSVIFISIAMALAPSEPDPAEPYRRVKGDSVLMLLQCVVGVVAMLLPSFLKRKLRVVIPSKMMVLFAVFLGVVWEFYEFTADGILHTNMQKFALESGEPLVGRAALMDTMKDLIVDTVGALVMAIVGYISIKYQKGWVEKLQLRREKKRPKESGV